ncbi:MAG: phospholipase D family protein [Pirellulaceae bacterium]
MDKLILDRLSATAVHRSQIGKIISQTNGTIRIVSPYVSESNLFTDLDGREILLLTSCDIPDFIRGSSDFEAVKRLASSGVKIKLHQHSSFLHAKVYIFGDHHAVISSANCTRNAMDSNIEAGIRVDEEDIKNLLDWFHELWNAAQDLTPEHLAIACQTLAKESDAQKQAVEQDRRLEKLSWRSNFEDRLSRREQVERRGQLKKGKESVRYRTFQFLASRPDGARGQEVSLYLTNGNKPDHIPALLKDAIVSSPPYIRREEKRPGERGVRYFLTDDGLRAIEKGPDEVNSLYIPSAIGKGLQRDGI